MRTTTRASWAGALLATALLLPACGTAPGGTAVEQAPAADAPTSAATEPTPSPRASAATKPAADKPRIATKSTLVLAEGAKGEKVRDLQVRLRDLDRYEGTITGKYGQSTVKGVKGFQDKRGLKKTGRTSTSPPGSS